MMYMCIPIACDFLRPEEIGKLSFCCRLTQERREIWQFPRGGIVKCGKRLGGGGNGGYLACLIASIRIRDCRLSWRRASMTTLP